MFPLQTYSNRKDSDGSVKTVSKSSKKQSLWQQASIICLTCDKTVCQQLSCSWSLYHFLQLWVGNGAHFIHSSASKTTVLLNWKWTAHYVFMVPYEGKSSLKEFNICENCNIVSHFPLRHMTEETSIQLHCGSILHNLNLNQPFAFIDFNVLYMTILNVSSGITVCLWFRTVWGWKAKWFLFHLLLSWWPWTSHTHTHTYAKQQGGSNLISPQAWRRRASLLKRDEIFLLMSNSTSSVWPQTIRPHSPYCDYSLLISLLVSYPLSTIIFTFVALLLKVFMM